MLNGCQSRFLILDFAGIPGVEVWAIGNEGGFLATPVNLTANNGNRLLMALAERSDLIVDFTNVPVGRYVLRNVGPDEPYGGGEPNPDGDFDAADPDTTGQILQFRVVPAKAPDPTTPPQFLKLPPIAALPAPQRTRPLAIIEAAGVGHDADGSAVEGPVEAMLGIVSGGLAQERLWMDPITENPAVGDTEVWEFYNTTADAHPMHIHEIAFEVVDRQDLALDAEGEVTQPVQAVGARQGPQSWETGLKDTVTALPGQVTRVKAKFSHPGQFVWHCHIVEHEDNEMMRPYRIGPAQPGQPS
jgi:FtsP/CotA-like multicopper oxidase with cupredoxin domain